jgi:tRNA nucleotidyltransferase (CCA-adding enzyme)
MPTLTYPGVRRFMVEVEVSNMDNLMRLKEADLYAHTKYKWDEKFSRMNELDRMYRKIIEDKDCLAIRDMQIRGDDLIEYGIKPGPAMGEILQKLFETVLDDPKMNDHEKLTEAISGMI